MHPTAMPTLGLSSESKSLSLSFLSESILAIVLLSVAGAVVLLILILLYFVYILHRNLSALNRIIVGFDGRHNQPQLFSTAVQATPSPSIHHTSGSNDASVASFSCDSARKEVPQLQSDNSKEIGCVEIEPSVIEGTSESNL
jgi:hypothetical protein